MLYFRGSCKNHKFCLKSEFCKGLFILIFAIAPLFSADHTDREIAKQFEQLASNSLGVLPQLSPDIRARRIGPVIQKVSLSDDGVMTIEQNFICKSIDGSEKVPGRTFQRFYLSDLQQKAPSSQRYEINRHVNTLTIISGKGSCALSFASERDLDKAEKLFKTLMMRAPQSQRDLQSLSELARAFGYTYLVVAPRAHSQGEAFRLLQGPEQSSSVVTWLTKWSAERVEELLAESRHALPLLLYDLSVLDHSSFYTQSVPFLSTFSICSLGNELDQSIMSDDIPSLKVFFKSAPFAGVRFDRLPDLSTPTMIFCKPSEKHKIQKAAASSLSTQDLQWVQVGEGDDEEASPAQVSCWLTPLQANSDDLLRHVLLNEPLLPSTFAGPLYREFPFLETLLQCPGAYRKENSIAEGIILTTTALSKNPHLSAQPFRLLKIALFAHELGAPFGSFDQLGYNSWPLALCVAEKVGLSENEIRRLKALIESPLPFDEKKRKLSEPLAFLEEARTADALCLSVGEWLDLKIAYWKAITAHWKKVPEQAQVALDFLAQVRRQYTSLCSFGIPRGVALEKGCGLNFSSIWEARDSKHRDGMVLKRRRDKYEQMVVEDPTSSWKGRFWEWLSRETV